MNPRGCHGQLCYRRPAWWRQAVRLETTDRSTSCPWSTAPMPSLLWRSYFRLPSIISQLATWSGLRCPRPVAFHCTACSPPDPHPTRLLEGSSHARAKGTPATRQQVLTLIPLPLALSQRHFLNPRFRTTAYLFAYSCSYLFISLAHAGWPRRG